MMRGIESAPVHLHADINEMRNRLIKCGNDRIGKAAHSHWDVSIEGARCALLLSEWLGGLHHLPRNRQAHVVDWSGAYVEIVSYSFGNGLSTYDGASLTRLVILSHEHTIRAELSSAMRSMRLLLHPRDARLGGMSSLEAPNHFYERHKSLVELRDEISVRIGSMSKESK